MSYAKFFVALGAPLSSLGEMLSSGHVSSGEIGTLVGSVVTSVLVYLVPNATKKTQTVALN